MDRNHDTLHYHIRWSGKAKLDWESFMTCEDAQANARKLVQPGEAYTIEEIDAACPQCQGVVKSAHGTEVYREPE